MQKILMTLGAIGLLAVALAMPGANAQEPQNPEFKDAPISDVLKWAQGAIGCGFIFEGADLLKDGQPRKVSAEKVVATTKAERTLVLFELLRRAELVAFEVEGLPGPTYQVVKGSDAARYATVVASPEAARKYYFAALSIKLNRAEPAKAAAAIRAKLTPLGQVEIFEATHTVIVSDFSDRLAAAFETAMAADNPAERDDDVVLADFAPKTLSAKRMSAALERLRSKGESWQTTVNEPTNVLLVSGRRDEMGRVSNRFKLLEARPTDPAFAEEVQTFKVANGSAEEAARTLKQMFEAEINAGSVQIGAYERAQKIIFRGSKADAQRAADALKAVDIAPDAAPKDKK